MKIIIGEFYSILASLYPEESNGSRASLFLQAYNDGVIFIDELKEAERYYGRLWNYAGD